MDRQNKAAQRHCMVVHAYYPLAETRVQREAEALLKHGIEVDVICLGLPREDAFEVVRGVNVYRLSAHRTETGGNLARQLMEYLWFFILVAVKLTQLHLRRRYDVIQVHNLPDFLVFCTLIPRLGGTPVILDIHDVSPEFFADRAKRPMGSWLVRLVSWQEQLSCRFASHVITVTEPWRQALIRRGVPEHKSSVVMNVADSGVFNPAVRRRVATQRTNGTFCLIYHGVQSYRHGLDLLLHAMAKLCPQIPELRLTLHGEGNYHQELVRLVEELGLAECVNLSTKYVPISELPSLIAVADVGVVPYRRDVFTDGILPTKLMEYVSLKIPVIASRTPAIDAYFDETMVEFFEPESIDDLAGCIVRLYADETRRQQLVQGGQMFRQRYSWEKISTDYVTLVKRLGAKGN
jgi:glycosyltransferase involved in cell wall biosynthesis